MGPSHSLGMEYKPPPIVLLQIKRNMGNKLLGYPTNRRGLTGQAQ